MIVPFAKGQQAQQAPTQAQPSETDMLMALAVMDQQGRFNNLPANSDNLDNLQGLGGERVIEDLRKGIPKNIYNKNNMSRKMTPGEERYDPVLGPMSPRDVRGD